MEGFGAFKAAPGQFISSIYVAGGLSQTAGFAENTISKFLKAKGVNKTSWDDL